jgi:hypothetical protein
LLEGCLVLLGDGNVTGELKGSAAVGKLCLASLDSLSLAAMLSRLQKTAFGTQLGISQLSRAGRLGVANRTLGRYRGHDD